MMPEAVQGQAQASDEVNFHAPTPSSVAPATRIRIP
jgi:hypothetical protein